MHGNVAVLINLFEIVVKVIGVPILFCFFIYFLIVDRKIFYKFYYYLFFIIIFFPFFTYLTFSLSLPYKQLSSFIIPTANVLTKIHNLIFIPFFLTFFMWVFKKLKPSLVEIVDREVAQNNFKKYFMISTILLVIFYLFSVYISLFLPGMGD